MTMLKRLLVINQGGFFGTHLVKRLVQSFSVIYVDSQPLSVDLPSHSLFYQGDSADFEALKPLLNQANPDVLLVLPETPVYLQQCLDAFLQIPSLVSGMLISSSDVVSPGYWPHDDTDTTPITEEAKKMADSEKIWRSASWGTRFWTVLRCAPLWGPGMPDTTLMSYCLEHCDDEKKLQDLTALKSVSFSGNLAYQISRLISEQDQFLRHKTIYVADYPPVPLKSIVEEFNQDGSLFKTKASPVGLLAAKAKRLVNLSRYPYLKDEHVLDTSLARLICGELPFSVKEAVSQTVSWMQTSR